MDPAVPRDRGFRPRRPDLHLLPAVPGAPAPAGADDDPRVRLPAHAAVDGAGVDRAGSDGDQARLAAASTRWWAPALTTRDRRARRRSSSPGATGGTFLTYDASLPWVYHEVYMWAVAAAVGGFYWMVRTCLAPSTHTVFWLVRVRARHRRVPHDRGLGDLPGHDRSGPAAQVPSVQPRAPCAVVAHRARRGGDRSRASIALNLYKFDAVYMFPLKDQVWTQVNQHRQRRARRQRRHAERTAVLHHLVHGLPAPRRHPVHRLLPVDHAAGPAREAVQRGVRRPGLPHRQRHRLHVDLHAPHAARRRGRVLAQAQRRGRPPADPAGRERALHRRRDDLRLLLHPLHQRLRARHGPRRRDRHGPARAVRRHPSALVRAGDRLPRRRDGLRDPGPDGHRALHGRLPPPR